jgi:hypothetical protein
MRFDGFGGLIGLLIFAAIVYVAYNFGKTGQLMPKMPGGGNAGSQWGGG